VTDWNLHARLCDRCAAMAERDEETPIADYCAKCKVKVWRWACEIFGSTPTEEEIRSLEEER